jgi:hypothetical protein
MVIDIINNRPNIRDSQDVVIGDIVNYKVIGSRKLFVKSTNIAGLYDYGCEQLEDGIYHKKGYIWSSRAGVINKYLNMSIVDVVYNGRLLGMDKSVLEPLINTIGYGVSNNPMVSEDDIYYSICKIS